MVCKYCKETISRKWIRLTEVVSVYHGDHDELEVTDAGVLCSNDCLVAYVSKTQE